MADRKRDPVDLSEIADVERICLRNLLASSNEAIYFKDRHNRFMLVSRGVVEHHVAREAKKGTPEISGLGPGFFVGKTDRDLFEPTLAEEWMAEEQRIIETGAAMDEVLERDTSLDDLGGWFRTSKGPLRDDDGTVIGTFGISRDVTAQVRAEMEVARREAQLRAVLDSSPDAIVCYNQELRYEMVNTQAALFMGVKPDEVVGLTDEELGRAPEVLSVLLPALHKVLETKVKCEVEFPAQVGGETIWWHARMVPQVSADGDVTGVVMAARDLTELKAVQSALAHQALHDHLTGLANRLALVNRLEEALAELERRPGGFVVLFIDIDNFKLVNDAYGHEAGDEILIEVASRLTRATRRGDMVARLGGDEFVVLFDTPSAERDARVLGNRVLRSLRRRFVYDGETLAVTASVGGVVVSDPGADPEEVLRGADFAMYSAKAKGKDRVELFRPVARGADADEVDPVERPSVVPAPGQGPAAELTPSGAPALSTGLVPSADLTPSGAPALPTGLVPSADLTPSGAPALPTGLVPSATLAASSPAPGRLTPPLAR